MTINTKIFGTADFNFEKRALFTFNAPFDCTDETTISKFEISGTEPPNTSRRIIFKIDDVLYRFVNGVLDKYIWRGEVDDVLKFGNTADELLALENVNAFRGKKISPIVAMSANNADVMPRIKISLKVSSYNDLYTVYKYSPIFETADNARLVSIKKNSHTDGNATELTECRIKKITGWTDWQNYILAENQIASAIQFRTKFIVSTLDGTDAAAIDSIKVTYIDDADKCAADSLTFFTKTENYDGDLKTCYLLVKSKPHNANIRAFVSFNPATDKILNYQLGVTNGEIQTFTLPEFYCKQDTLHIELDGVPTFNFNFDTQNSTITLQADAGKIVTASFEFTRAENWHEMTCDYSDDFKQRFTFRTVRENLRECCVRFFATGYESTIENEELGVGDGKKQRYILEAAPRQFSCNVPHKLDRAFLETLAPIGKPVIVSYDWKGDLPEIESYVAGFSC